MPVGVTLEAFDVTFVMLPSTILAGIALSVVATATTATATTSTFLLLPSPRRITTGVLLPGLSLRLREQHPPTFRLGTASSPSCVLLECLQTPHCFIKRQGLEVKELFNPGHDIEKSFRHSIKQFLH